MINIIAAVAKNGVIGSKNDLPWYIPEDLQHFRKRTKGGIVIMGRKTFESIGKPLPERLNIVVTSKPITQSPNYRNLNEKSKSREVETQNSSNQEIDQSKDQDHKPQTPNLIAVNSLDEAIEKAHKDHPGKEIWLIGGYGIFTEALDRNLVDQLYLTEIDKQFEGDIFFPTYDYSEWNLESSESLSSESGINISFNKYVRKG